MTHNVVFSDEAEEDVAEILAYLLPRAGENTARRYVERLIDYCHTFEIFPERGMRYIEDPKTRHVGYERKATIVFRVDGSTVTILRIFHRGRNVDLDDDRPDEAD
jgi:plasmid stabilization system protein ParE